MAFETLLSNLILAGVAGTIISGLRVLSADGKTWDWRKYLFSVGIAVLAALVYIDGLGQAVTEETILPLFLGIIGTSWIGSELQQIAGRLRGN
jgi:hypothetical protein